MPELPEVETVKRVLSELVISKEIESIEILYPRIIQNMDSQNFCELLKGQEIIKVERRGKFLLFKCTHHTIVSHLRMEGKYNFYKEKTENTKHDHIIFKFTDKTYLKYNDVRKFGTMELVLNEDLQLVKSLIKLGIDANSNELEVKEMIKIIKTKNKAIKEVLLMQDVIAGIGNIYASEILFLAKVNPEKKASDLTKKEIEEILIASKEVLDEAVKMGGTTVKSFAVTGDVSGLFQHSLTEYDRADEPCFNCGKPISKMKQGGRTTYYCSSCQK